MYTTSGAICLKAAGNKLKEKLTSTTASAKLVKEKGPMVGKMLKLCKDMSVLSDQVRIFLFLSGKLRF